MKLSLSKVVLVLIGLAGAIAAVPHDAAAAQYSPKALEELKESCTTKAGKFSQICVDWSTTGRDTAEFTASSEPAMTIGACFREAKDFDEHGVSSSTGNAAEKLMRGKAAGNAGHDNKFVNECIRVTKLQLPADWTQAVEYSIFQDGMRKKIDQDFPSKCGSRADFRPKVDPFGLIMWNKVKSKTVFAEAKDPEGRTVSVLCNGSVVLKDPKGKGWTIAPRTIAEIKAEEKKSCVAYCRAHDDVCLDGYRSGKTTPLCKSHCDSKCG